MDKEKFRTLNFLKNPRKKIPIPPNTQTKFFFHVQSRPQESTENLFLKDYFP